MTDGITLRTAKFITGNFIPVLGRMFTDATDTVISASLLLKNTVGILGVAILICIAAFPAIKVLSLAFIYKLAPRFFSRLEAGPSLLASMSSAKRHLYFCSSRHCISHVF